MKLYLAPMEGIVDYSVRQILTQINSISDKSVNTNAPSNSNKSPNANSLIPANNLNGIDLCVTEFIRVTDKLIPIHVILRHYQELKSTHKSKTESGVLVIPQLLGSDPICVSENAHQLIELGAPGIDLNFGCPAKTVNRHDGGATLLKSSDRLYNVVQACRKIVPMHLPVSAKMRLGFSSPEPCVENALAIQSAGANRLTIHARTKEQGYQPPVQWEWIGKVKSQTTIPLVANGDILNFADLLKCKELSGCEDFMIGRGFLYDPLIFIRLKEKFKNGKDPVLQLKPFFIHFFELSMDTVSPHYAQAKTKQWLKSLAKNKSEVMWVFDKIKAETDPFIFLELLKNLLPDNLSI